MTTRMTGGQESQRTHLRELAVAAMRARGLEPEFPPDAVAEANAMAAPRTTEEAVRDLRALLWCSIDNDESRDLDQLSVGEDLGGGRVKILVAVADVDAAVRKGSALDRHAAVNTVSVYTPAVIFPMLPERLSTDLTSLADDQDRLSVVVEMIVDGEGTVATSDVYGARVRNRAKLAYHSVGAWLEGSGPLPAPAAAVSGMHGPLRMQDAVAQALARRRHVLGSLEFGSIEAEPMFDGDRVTALRAEAPNRARSLIENFMVAANGIVARFLDERGCASIRRVVRAPKRWDRIVALAAGYGVRLPEQADSRALSDFLSRRRAAAPDEFPDLSRSISKMLGSGEDVVDRPGADAPGHFGLAVRDYTHSTAPNRRYPDLLTQRLLKSALAGHPPPYSTPELEQLAARCTTQEDAAAKVERQTRKSAAAMVVASRVGERWEALVTGASPKGTFVRVLDPPVEGMLVAGQAGLDVGDRVTVRLLHVDVDRGFIDFERT